MDAVGPRSPKKIPYEDAVAVNELSSITFGKNAAHKGELEVGKKSHIGLFGAGVGPSSTARAPPVDTLHVKCKV